MWPASMQIHWNKRKCLHKKRVQIPQDLFGTPTWPPFHCFGTPIWPPWHHVKTLYKGRWIRSLVTLELMSNSRKKGHLLRVIFRNTKNLLIRAYILAWQNSWHFAAPTLASPPYDLWETSTETPLILMTCHYLELGSASDWLKQISHSGTTSQKHHPDPGSGASSVLNFCAHYSDFIRRETSGDITKCRLFSQGTYFQDPLHLYHFNRCQYSQLKCLCGPLTFKTTWRTPMEPLQLFP